MIKKNDYKYIFCQDDPSQIFNLSHDKNELINLCESQHKNEFDESIINELQHLRDTLYDNGKLSKLKNDVIKDQNRRRFIYQTMKNNSNWNYHPFDDRGYSRNRFMRNDKDLNELELTQRYPKNKW